MGRRGPRRRVWESCDTGSWRTGESISNLTRVFSTTSTQTQFVKELVFSHQDLLCGNILFNPDWCVAFRAVSTAARLPAHPTPLPTPHTTMTTIHPTCVTPLPHPPTATNQPPTPNGNNTRRPPRVQFIDFEYGGYNPRGFDFGNHFCEYAGFDPDYAKSYPGKPQQLHFLRRYIHALPPGSVETGADDDDGDGGLFLEELFVVANRYACAAHLFWGYWAVIQVRWLMDGWMDGWLRWMDAMRCDSSRSSVDGCTDKWPLHLHGGSTLP